LDNTSDTTDKVEGNLIFIQQNKAIEQIKILLKYDFPTISARREAS
jgi:hypothetical protein